MAENKKDISGVIENIAFATDKLQSTYPIGKIAIIIELNHQKFIEAQFDLDMYSESTDQFKIDISDVEVIFIKENTLKPQEEVKQEPPKKNFFKKLSSVLFSKKSS
jgi:hypothetical protein